MSMHIDARPGDIASHVITAICFDFHRRPAIRPKPREYHCVSGAIS